MFALNLDIRLTFFYYFPSTCFEITWWTYKLQRIERRHDSRWQSAPRWVKMFRTQIEYIELYIPLKWCFRFYLLFYALTSSKWVNCLLLKYECDRTKMQLKQNNTYTHLYLASSSAWGGNVLVLLHSSKQTHLIICLKTFFPAVAVTIFNNYISHLDGSYLG